MCAVKIGRYAHFFNQPAIRMRMHSQTWTSKAFLIWNCLYPELIWNLPGYCDAAKRAVIPRRPMHSPRRMLAARAYGSLNLSVWRQVIRASSQVHSKAFTLMLCLLPVNCSVASTGCDVRLWPGIPEASVQRLFPNCSRLALDDCPHSSVPWTQAVILWRPWFPSQENPFAAQADGQKVAADPQHRQSQPLASTTSCLLWLQAVSSRILRFYFLHTSDVTFPW